MAGGQNGTLQATIRFSAKLPAQQPMCWDKLASIYR